MTIQGRIDFAPPGSNPRAKMAIGDLRYVVATWQHQDGTIIAWLADDTLGAARIQCTIALRKPEEGGARGFMTIGSVRYQIDTWRRDGDTVYLTLSDIHDPWLDEFHRDMDAKTRKVA